MKDKMEVLNAFLSKGDFLLALGVIGVLCGILMPLPPFVIDVMLAFNIGIALVIIMVSTFVEKPLEFSVFPSILLFTTLLRIALNVGTTRKVLLEGYAGEIINAFGNFVVGGNYIVGTIIFIIIYVVQITVIVAGSTRISEVAARFTLDAMPGKQMTIDADLNSGLITETEARAKREELSRESDFYGAMDGAAKFVRGDVTAGLIITVINIIGGLTLGMLYRDLTFQEALQKYTLLTIGDGLVAQIPSLIISMASGIIVTRAASSKDSLGHELFGQMLINPRATGIGSFALFCFGLIPSMPLFPFWLIGAGLGGVSWYVSSQTKKNESKEAKILEDEKTKKAAGPEPVDELLHIDVMGIEIGYGLISLVDTSQGGDLLERINGIRRQFAIDLGLIVPPIRIRDNMQLNPNEYIIKIKNNEIAKGELMPEFFLAMNPSGKEDELVGIQTKEPAFGLPATWVNEAEKNRAESLGFTVVDAATVLATHLKEIIKKFGSELLVRQDVQGMVDNLKKRYPSLVDDVIPGKINVAHIHRLLQNLLREQVSIRNLITIFEVIGDYAATIKDMEVMTEYVRTALRMEISRKYASDNGILYIITLDPKLEQHLLECLHKGDFGSTLLIDPALRNGLVEKLSRRLGRASEAGVSPVLLISPSLRPYFRKSFEKDLGILPVLSYSEIADNIKVQSLEMISLESSKNSEAGVR